MAQNNLTKILVVGLVLVVIAGIWGYKYFIDSPAVPSGGSAADRPSQDQLDRAAFEVDSIDVDELKSSGLPILINFSGDG
jgi:hypothetical protein